MASSSSPARSSCAPLLDFRCEGVLLIGAELSTADLANLGGKVPSVVIARRVPTDGLDVVRTADGRGIASVVDYLVGLGHRRVVHVSGGPGVIATDRRNGYLRAMRKHDFPAVIDQTGKIWQQWGWKVLERSGDERARI